MTFLQDLDKFARVRSQVANALNNIATTLKQGETEGEQKSGRLELEREIEDLEKASQNLREGVFRLLVLGDMKRGKSTFLNALIGENLLPSDVNPCTALLTVLRYGPEKQVTIYFTDNTPPKKIDFNTYKQEYTIDPTEAKRLEKEQKQAFPNVDYAVVEYPLPILAKGIEIVDSPGLNDTESRNELSLGYINNCHAILFVLSASQPCTLGERRYLENYLQDRGLTVFFLINAWDRVKANLIDPDDPEELGEAEYKLRQVFQTNLLEYCQVDGRNLYEQRVFELSSLQALRNRLKDADSDLAGTGFPEFLAAMNTFLIQERAIAELRQGRILARQSSSKLQEGVARRIPLLSADLEELKQKISSVEPEFAKLKEIGQEFKGEIREVRDEKAKAIADSFRQYVLNLGNTFEADFLRYQPSLDLFDLLSPGQRQTFELQMQRAFESYINDKLSSWSRGAEKKMDAAFTQLSTSAKNYGTNYTQVTDRITEKLTGQKIPAISSNNEDNSPSWAKWAAGIFSLASGNIAGLAMAGAGFDWKSIVLNFITVMGLGTIIVAFTGLALGPLYLALLGLGVGILQADGARKELVKVAKKELVKHLPTVATERWQTVYDAVKECFDSYEQEVMERVEDDIAGRKGELDNLVQQKESQEIDRDAELERLGKLKENVESQREEVEKIYQRFVA